MVRIERLIIVVLGMALLQAWWKLYRGVMSVYFCKNEEA